MLNLRASLNSGTPPHHPLDFRQKGVSKIEMFQFVKKMIDEATDMADEAVTPVANYLSMVNEYGDKFD